LGKRFHTTLGDEFLPVRPVALRQFRARRAKGDSVRNPRDGKRISVMARNEPLVTVVTPTTGNPTLLRALESVSRQSHKPIQHLVFNDGAELQPELKKQILQYNIDLIEMPYPTGRDRFNGHRIYGASAFLGNGDHFCFLDEDNWFDTNHVASLLEVINGGRRVDWAFSLRKIVDADAKFTVMMIAKAWGSGHRSSPKTISLSMSDVIFSRARSQSRLPQSGTERLASPACPKSIVCSLRSCAPTT
jgi:Glycosyl transferase family 2